MDIMLEELNSKVVFEEDYNTLLELIFIFCRGYAGDFGPMECVV